MDRMKRLAGTTAALLVLPIAACGSSGSGSHSTVATPTATASAADVLTAAAYAKQMRCASSGQGMDVTGVLSAAGAEDFTSCKWGNDASGEVVLARFDSSAQATTAAAKVPSSFAHYAYKNFVVVGTKTSVGVAKYCQDPATPDSACS